MATSYSSVPQDLTKLQLGDSLVGVNPQDPQMQKLFQSGSLQTVIDPTSKVTSYTVKNPYTAPDTTHLPDTSGNIVPLAQGTPTPQPTTSFGMGGLTANQVSAYLGSLGRNPSDFTGVTQTSAGYDVSGVQSQASFLQGTQNPTTTGVNAASQPGMVGPNFGSLLGQYGSVFTAQQQALEAQRQATVQSLSAQESAQLQQMQDVGQSQIGGLNRMLGESGAYTTGAGAQVLYQKKAELTRNIGILQQAFDASIAQANAAYAVGNADLAQKAFQTLTDVYSQMQSQAVQSAQLTIQQQQLALQTQQQSFTQSLQLHQYGLQLTQNQRDNLATLGQSFKGADLNNPTTIDAITRQAQAFGLDPNSVLGIVGAQNRIFQVENIGKTSLTPDQKWAVATDLYKTGAYDSIEGAFDMLNNGATGFVSTQQEYQQGAIGGGTTGTAQGQPAPTSSTAGVPNPTGINIPQKLNNPGALVFANQPGATPYTTKDGRTFATFKTLQDGWNALYADLSAKMTGNSRTGLNGNSTLSDLINVWAPLADGNDPKAYTADVLNHLSKDLNMSLNPNTKLSTLTPYVQQVAHAIAVHEGLTAVNPGYNPDAEATAGPGNMSTNQLPPNYKPTSAYPPSVVNFGEPAWNTGQVNAGDLNYQNVMNYIHSKEAENPGTVWVPGAGAVNVKNITLEAYTGVPFVDTSTGKASDSNVQGYLQNMGMTVVKPAIADATRRVDIALKNIDSWKQLIQTSPSTPTDAYNRLWQQYYNNFGLAFNVDPQLFAKKTFQSQVITDMQTAGSIQGERIGGNLISRFDDYIPQINDTKDVAMAKLNTLSLLMKNSQLEDLGKTAVQKGNDYRIIPLSSKQKYLSNGYQVVTQ